MSIQIPSPIECRADTEALSEIDIKEYLQLLPGWNITQIKGVNILEKRYKFRDFAGALEFTNKVGAIAEEVDHHPQLVTEWGSVTIRWWSHNIQGLRLIDVAMAKRCDLNKLS